MDFRSRIWVASFAGDRIRRDTPLALFDALALAAQARREMAVRMAERLNGLDPRPGSAQGVDLE